MQSRYYDPELGRFLNADALASTKKVSLGCNIFAYCQNNPVNRIDSDGYDAIWIHESNSAAGFGHSGLLVEDEESGQWYYFYWGPADETPSLEVVAGVENGSYVQEITTNGVDLRDIDVLREILAAAGGKAGDRANAITDIYYFEGDYTATLVAIGDMVNSGEEYNLLTNNCVQKTITALSASDSRFDMVAYGTENYLIPNRAAYKVAMLPSNKESYPWKLLFYNVLFE